ncbi:MAG: alpha/beta hydrolase [Polyangiales bacterium]
MSARFELLRRRAGAALAEGFFQGMSRAARLHPLARPARHGVEVIDDVAYDPAHPTRRLDVWRPLARPADALLPVVLYVHGGGFRILSKETHWVMALAFARRGYVVFNIDYRLAPTHPFPAALEDAAEAYAWVCAHAGRYGGDPQRLVLAGESAGANLVTALTVGACFERDEVYARRVFDAGVLPRAVLPACGLHQVSDPGRFRRRKPALSRFVADRIEEVTHGYLGDQAHGPDAGLADPLCVVEGAAPHARPLPPFFLACGTADPILDDTRRLQAALAARGAVAEARYYPGEPHAFHALVFRERARRCWADTFDFLDRHVPR